MFKQLNKKLLENYIHKIQIIDLSSFWCQSRKFEFIMEGPKFYNLNPGLNLITTISGKTMCYMPPHVMHYEINRIAYKHF